MSLHTIKFDKYVSTKDTVERLILALESIQKAPFIGITTPLDSSNECLDAFEEYFGTSVSFSKVDNRIHRGLLTTLLITVNDALDLVYRSKLYYDDVVHYDDVIMRNRKKIRTISPSMKEHYPILPRRGVVSKCCSDLNSTMECDFYLTWDDARKQRKKKIKFYKYNTPKNKNDQACKPSRLHRETKNNVSKNNRYKRTYR